MLTPLLTDDAELAHSESYTAGTGSQGVLLLHGIAGTPASMRPWAEHLVAQGYRVSVPRLPGHGTTWQDLSTTRWIDWYASADDALTELLGSTDAAAVCGLSMGGALALRLAIERPLDVEAIVLVNPSIANDSKLLFALPVLQHAIASMNIDAPKVNKPGVPRDGYDRMSLKAVRSMTRLWRDVRPRLGAVNQPLLLFRSLHDGPSGAMNSSIVLGEVASTQVREVLLHDSYHVATLDYDAGRIFADSTTFLTTWLRAQRGGGR